MRPIWVALHWRAPVEATVAKRRNSPKRPRMLIALTVVGGIALLLLFVYPTQTLINQWSQTGVTEKRLEAINEATSKLKADSKRLLSDTELERIAREQYGLVRPGETQYVLVPQAPLDLAPPTTPSTQSPRPTKK